MCRVFPRTACAGAGAGARGACRGALDRTLGRAVQRNLRFATGARADPCRASVPGGATGGILGRADPESAWRRSEEHTSELQSLMRISYAVFCLKKKKKTTK